MPSDIAAIEMRPPSSTRIASIKPSPSLPSRFSAGTMQSSKIISAVSLALNPSLFSFLPGRKENKLGLRASDTAEMIFEDCIVPAENLLGKEGDGFIDAMRVLEGGRISIAAMSL